MLVLLCCQSQHQVCLGDQRFFDSVVLLLVGGGGCSRQCEGHGEEVLCSFPLKKEAGEVHPIIFS